MTRSLKLKPIHVDGFRLEAWNEEDATVVNAVLAGSTEETMTVPTGAKVVRLIATTDTFYNLSATAVIPSDDSSDDSFLPGGAERWITIQNSTAISLIAVGTPTVVGHFWA